MVGENGLSENKFGFPKGRSTVDAIQAVVYIATKARRETGKPKGFCALISTHTQCVQYHEVKHLHRGDGVKKVPDYLLRMIDDYLSDRWVICESDKWSLKDEMTFGAPLNDRW